jgi:hypothetical protein
MLGGRHSLLAFAAMVLAAGCVGDGPTQGHRDRCADATGALIGCEEVEISTPEEACWRLVECGVIPLVNGPETDWAFDWDACVRNIERLPDSRYGLVLSCIEASTCEELRVERSPTTPNEDPPCLAYGDL